MTLGMLLIMIAFDGCLYAAIGYLIARYTDSGTNPTYFPSTFENNSGGGVKSDY